MAENPSRTEIASLGEFGLIERYRNQVKSYQVTTLKGIGDDAAIIASDSTRQLLVSTDMLVEGIHFDLTYMPLKHLGYKAMVVNFSDIVAMNAVPTQVTVSLALSNRFSVEAIDEIYAGIFKACEDYKVDLVGGDTTASMAGLVISITVMGTQTPQKIAKRSGAKPLDVICVTGDLGGAYLGLQVLAREKQGYTADPDYTPDLSEYEYVVGCQLKPEARTDMVHELNELGVVPTAMIDISDGLASELLHICKESQVGAVIYESTIPIENAAKLVASEFQLDPITCALNGGEDYQVLFTVPQENWEKIKHLPDVTAIGIIREAGEGVGLMSSGGNYYPLTAQGWNHFQS